MCKKRISIYIKYNLVLEVQNILMSLIVHVHCIKTVNIFCTSSTIGLYNIYNVHVLLRTSIYFVPQVPGYI
jgi:hypothetical protein